jgi:hypothetical protein
VSAENETIFWKVLSFTTRSGFCGLNQILPSISRDLSAPAETICQLSSFHAISNSFFEICLCLLLSLKDCFLAEPICESVLAKSLIDQLCWIGLPVAPAIRDSALRSLHLVRRSSSLASNRDSFAFL